MGTERGGACGGGGGEGSVLLNLCFLRSRVPFFGALCGGRIRMVYSLFTHFTFLFSSFLPCRLSVFGVRLGLHNLYLLNALPFLGLCLCCADGNVKSGLSFWASSIVVVGLS